MKSSLKTFLAGKNGLEYTHLPIGCKLANSTVLNYTCYGDLGQGEDSFMTSIDEVWCVDVLDDGTAITYCRD